MATPTAPDPDVAASEPARRRLSREDWTQAALDAIGEDGLAGVAVEPLAARLGATKGSFYWHFTNRRALVEAALDRWEREHTEAVITEADREPEPRARLRRLLGLVMRLTRSDRVELALLADADDALVAPVLQRVTERRVQYVASLYEDLGQSPTEARGWAVIAVSAYLGQAQLAHATPALLPRQDEEWADHLERLGRALTPPVDGRR